MQVSAAPAPAHAAQASTGATRARPECDFGRVGLHTMRSVNLVDTAAMALEIGFKSWRLMIWGGRWPRFRYDAVPWHLP